MKVLGISALFAVCFGVPAPPTIIPMMNESLFQGDIMGIDPHADRSALIADIMLWPNAIIPYVIAPEREDIRELIGKAMHHIEAHTCIRFVERTNEKDYVKIIKDKGCWAYMGLIVRGEQPLSLGGGCEYFAVIIHELMHLMGFFHEHNRSDRDDHVTILWENIADKNKHLFQKQSPEESRILTPFDLSSLMMYGSGAYINKFRVHSMLTKDGRVIEENHDRKSMSALDAAKINLLYKCKE